MKIFTNILDDLAVYGSLVFYVMFTLTVYLIGNLDLFWKLAYGLLLSLILILCIKSFHYKERPQAEEFTIFLEKVIASSFPSTHSLNATVLSLLLIFTYPLPWLIALCGVFSLSVYVQRYIAKKHFFVDIFSGILIGIAEAIFVMRVL